MFSAPVEADLNAGDASSFVLLESEEEAMADLSYQVKCSSKVFRYRYRNKYFQTKRTNQFGIKFDFIIRSFLLFASILFYQV